MSIAEIRERWAGGIVLEVHLQQAKRDIHTLLAALDAATAERDAARRNCDDARLEVKQLQCVVSNAFREREAAQQRIAELEAALELMVNAYPNMTDEVWREGDRVLREVQP